MSDAEADDLWTWMQSKPQAPLTLAEARKAPDGR
jgi:hypothetical protein